METTRRIDEEKSRTANTRYNGFGQLAQWEIGFVFGSFGITERLRIFNPKPAVVPER